MVGFQIPMTRVFGFVIRVSTIRYGSVCDAALLASFPPDDSAVVVWRQLIA